MVFPRRKQLLTGFAGSLLTRVWGQQVEALFKIECS